MFSWDSYRKSKRRRMKCSGDVNARWVSLSHAALEMTVLLMRIFSCLTYLPLFDLSLELIIFKEKKNKNKPRTNKHKNHHQENNLFSGGSVCDLAAQLVPWVHRRSNRRKSDKQIMSEQITSSVELSTQANSDSSRMRGSEIAKLIEWGRNHQCINAAWAISEANPIKPDLALSQPGWCWKGPLEVSWSNPPAPMLKQVQSTKGKELLGTERQTSMWITMKLLETNNNKIKAWKVLF